jgi:FG-GAP-like repeat/Dual-action HEIGH metallo-peptidase
MLRAAVWMMSFGLIGCVADAEHLSSTAGESFEDFEARTYREPLPGGAYIVNGDVPVFGRAALEEFWASFQQGALTVNTIGGVDDAWNIVGKRNITFCMAANFGTHASDVNLALTNAIATWEGLADVRFYRRSTEDGAGCTASNTNVVFDVRQVWGQPYYARSFFPSSARPGRELLIDTSIYGQSVPLEHIVGHELGHILGFRHEHTRPEAGTCFEDNNWRALTIYDSASIMHYPWCRGTSLDMNWTTLDALGAAALYGAHRSPDDIVWRNTATNAATVWLMNGTVNPSSVQLATIPGADWQIQKVADFDGNGKADILWRNTGTGEVKIWFMNGSTILAQTSVATATNDWQIQGAGDFDGDGKADILWRNTGSNQPTIWLMNGASVVSQLTLATVPGADWVIQRTGDFDGDSKADILWRNTGTGEVKIWFMNGGTIVAQTSVLTVTSDWLIQGGGDFNADGMADILWRNTDGTVRIWLMRGATIASTTTPGVVTSDWSIQGAADFNADATSDILWRRTDGTVNVWTMHLGSKLVEQVMTVAPSEQWVIQSTGNLDL